MRALAFCLSLLPLAGCALSPGRSFAPTAWAREVHDYGTFPVARERTVALGGGQTIALRLEFPDAGHGTLAFGDGLVLKVLDPVYLDGWARLSLRDIDGDGTDDLRFSAVLLPERVRTEVFFLRRPGAWERYVLPSLP